MVETRNFQIKIYQALQSLVFVAFTILSAIKVFRAAVKNDPPRLSKVEPKLSWKTLAFHSIFETPWERPLWNITLTDSSSQRLN